MNPTLSPTSPRTRLIGSIQGFLIHEPRALRVLAACALAMVSTTIDPPFLSLTSASVQTTLRAAEGQAPLRVAAEYLALAVITLIGGTTGDWFGRRRVLLIGLAGVVAAKVLSLFTVGTPSHSTFHTLGVIAAVLVVPMTVAIVTLTFEPALRPFAFGMLFGSQGVALLFGSLIKFVAEQVGALWLAFVPVVITGIVAIWLVARHVPESSTERGIQRTTALLHLVLLAVTFLMIFFVLSSGTLLDNWLLAAIALGTLVLAVATARWWVHRLAYYLNVDVFTSRDVVLAIVAGMIISGIQGMFLFEFLNFSYYAQGTSSFVASLRMVPYVLGVLIGSFMISQLAKQFGARRSIAAGMGLMAVGLLFMALIQLETSYWLMLLPILVMGYGFGIATPARAQVILSAPPTDLVGASAAVNTATGQLGFALGITTSSAIVTRLADSTFVRSLTELGTSQEVVDQVQQAFPDFATRAALPNYAQLPAEVSKFVTLNYDSAWTSGVAQLFLSFGIVMLIAAVVVFVGMSRQALTPKAQPVTTT